MEWVALFSEGKKIIGNVAAERRGALSVEEKNEWAAVATKWNDEIEEEKEVIRQKLTR